MLELHLTTPCGHGPDRTLGVDGGQPEPLRRSASNRSDGPPYTPAVSTCTSCGEQNQDSAKFCSSCGSNLASEWSKADREERRIVTVLFCDLVGSTALFDLADPEDVRETLADYLPRVQREVERYGGTVEKFIGDAVLAVYGVPTLHEDDAERALFSALRILPAIEEMNEGAEVPLAVRIGIESGEAVVDLGGRSTRQGMVFGDVVNTASRLQGVAPT